MATPLATTPAIAIIGGGPAGMSCALWLSQLGRPAVLLDHGDRLGGQLLGIRRINRWVLGLPGLSSAELAVRYADHIAATATRIHCQTRVLAVRAHPHGYQLTLTGDRVLDAPALVVATGVSAKGEALLPATANARLRGLVSWFALDHLEHLPQVGGQAVAVVGGGDNAYFTAKDLALAGAHVHLIRRSPAKAQPGLQQDIDALAQAGRISGHAPMAIRALAADGQGLCLDLAAADGGPDARLRVGRLFIRIGYAANSQFLGQFAAFAGLRTDDDGYVGVDSHRQTNLPWLYAIGDVANRRHQSVVAAVADGAIAAQHLNSRLP